MNDIVALLITVAGFAIVIWFINWDSKRSARLRKEQEDQTGIVRWLVGAEQPLGENEPTIFKPYRVEGCIDEREDEHGRKYYDGCVYVMKKK